MIIVYYHCIVSCSETIYLGINYFGEVDHPCELSISWVFEQSGGEWILSSFELMIQRVCISSVKPRFTMRSATLDKLKSSRLIITGIPHYAVEEKHWLEWMCFFELIVGKEFRMIEDRKHAWSTKVLWDYYNRPSLARRLKLTKLRTLIKTTHLSYLGAELIQKSGFV